CPKRVPSKPSLTDSPHAARPKNLRNWLRLTRMQKQTGRAETAIRTWMHFSNVFRNRRKWRISLSKKARPCLLTPAEKEAAERFSAPVQALRQRSPTRSKKHSATVVRRRMRSNRNQEWFRR